MKIIIIGASGYLGSEIMYQADLAGHEVLGTFCSQKSAGLIKFDFADRKTWSAVTNQSPDIVIWAAWSNKNYPPTDDPFTNFLDILHRTKIVYISSDAAFCKRTLASATTLGDYARRKHIEQSIVLERPGAAVFVTGPIFGTNSQGILDERTQKLLDKSQQKHEYWDNVYKTFVPVDGLARTIVASLGRTGQYFVGPPERKSYFQFYKSRARQHNLLTDIVASVKITDAELGKLGICTDTSYVDNTSRIWVA